MRIAVLDSPGTHGAIVQAIIRKLATKGRDHPGRDFRRNAYSARSKSCCRHWSGRSDAQVDLINLSIGTSNPDHAEPLLHAVTKCPRVVSAYGWLPGTLPNVIAVDEDRSQPPGTFHVKNIRGRRIIACNPAPHRGISFAVAAATGHLAGLSPEALNLLDLGVAQTKL